MNSEEIPLNSGEDEYELENDKYDFFLTNNNNKHCNNYKYNNKRSCNNSKDNNNNISNHKTLASVTSLENMYNSNNEINNNCQQHNYNHNLEPIKTKKKTIHNNSLTFT